MRLAAHLSAVRGRLLAVIVGVLAAAMPHIVAAQDAGSRALAAPDDTRMVVTLLGLSIAALIAVTSVAFLYRKQRGLRWDYQLTEGALSEGQGADPHESEH